MVWSAARVSSVVAQGLTFIPHISIKNERKYAGLRRESSSFPRDYLQFVKDS